MLDEGRLARQFPFGIDKNSISIAAAGLSLGAAPI